MKLVFVGIFNGQDTSYVSPDFDIIDQDNTLDYFFDEYLESEDQDEKIFWSSDVSLSDDRLIVKCDDFTSAAAIGGVQRWIDVIAKELNGSVISAFSNWTKE